MAKGYVVMVEIGTSHMKVYDIAIKYTKQAVSRACYFLRQGDVCKFLWFYISLEIVGRN